MKSLLVACLVLVALSSVAHAQNGAYNWTNIRPNIGQICPGLDFWSTTSGYILDFISGPGPLLLKTDDGAQTLTPALSGIDIIIMENIATSNNGQNAVTGGVSLFEPISIQTNNGGSSWIKSSSTVINSVFNDLDVLPNGDFVFYGTWTAHSNATGKPQAYAGLAYSNNKGTSYEYINWPYPTITPVAGNFIGASATVFVIGSAAPAVPNDDAAANYQRLLTAHKRAVTVDPLADFPANETYRSYVTLSTNAGQTWSTIYSSESTDNITGISLGGGYFLSATTGFISGMNHTTTGATAFLLGTTDTGKNWTPLIQLPGGVFTRVECISADECFVIGGAPGGPLGNGVVYHSTNAGKTWSQTLIPKITAFVDLSVVSSDCIYATSISAFQTCDIFFYGPPQTN